MHPRIDHTESSKQSFKSKLLKKNKETKEERKERNRVKEERNEHRKSGVPEIKLWEQEILNVNVDVDAIQIKDIIADTANTASTTEINKKLINSSDNSPVKIERSRKLVSSNSVNSSDSTRCNAGSCSSSDTSRTSRLSLFSSSNKSSLTNPLSQSDHSSFSCDEAITASKTDHSYIYSIHAYKLKEIHKQSINSTNPEILNESFLKSFPRSDKALQNRRVGDKNFSHDVIVIKKDNKPHFYLINNNPVHDTEKSTVKIAYQFPENIGDEKSYYEKMINSTVILKVCKRDSDIDGLRIINNTNTHDLYINDCIIGSMRYLVMRHIEGVNSLDYFYKRDPKLDVISGKRYIKPEDKFAFLRNQFNQMLYVHDKNQMHRDLKHDNYIHTKNNGKFIDVDDAIDENVRTYSADIGTPGYKCWDELYTKKSEIQVLGLLAADAISTYDYQNAFRKELVIKKNRAAQMKTCDLFLVSAMKVNILRLSSKGHLYLYKDDSGIFYYVDNEIAPQYIKDKSVLDKLQNANFDQSPANPTQCDDKALCASVIEYTFKQNHTNQYQQEINDVLSQTEVYNMMPDVFKNEVLGEIFQSNKILKTWLHKSINELFKILEPSFKDILPQDVVKLKANQTLVINEIVYRLFIFPELASICMALTQLDPSARPDLPVIISKLDELEKKYFSYSRFHNKHYDPESDGLGMQITTPIYDNILTREAIISASKKMAENTPEFQIRPTRF